MRTYVPLSAAPVQMASNRSPILEASSMAAADLVTSRSTLLVSFFFSQKAICLHSPASDLFQDTFPSCIRMSCHRPFSFFDISILGGAFF
jgi:hypothetical protein